MKLTTKLGFIFLTVIVILGAGLGFLGIPWIKSYLMKREIDYSVSFLKRESQYTRLRLLTLQKRLEAEDLSEEEIREEIRKIFAQTNEIFTQHFFHESARMFVIDGKGEIWQSSDPTRSGESVSNVWLYDDGQRDKLIQDINKRKNIAEHIHQFTVEELVDGGLIRKKLFVAYIPGLRLEKSFYICISENEADIFYFARLSSKAMVFMLAITILVFYIVFQVFYTRLRKRYDRVLEHAQLIAGGNYNVQIADEQQDEIGILAQTIDQLAAKMSMDKDFEEHYAQGQKMEMIGTLASGIAHDFNNMLGGILSGLDLVMQEMRLPANGSSPDLELVANTTRVTRDCANRGKETVEKLLSFSRKREANMLPMDLNMVLRSVQEICQHSFDKRIKMDVNKWPEQAVIVADRSLLEQAVMNVCINARDAMKKGGKLTLSIERVMKARPSPDKTAVKGPHWCLTVQDNGSGIKPEVLSRIFEPFYTTKEKGTGLGLAMVYKTIDDLDGWVDISSKVGLGTTFTFYFPVSDESLNTATPGSATEEPEEKPEEIIPEGKECVLVIDDDEFMLQMTEDILKRLGYAPIGAPDGERGIAEFTKHQDKIEIVVLDLMLPDKGGDEIFDELKALNPDIKVLLISGFKRDPRIADMLVKGCDGFLNKPYSIEDLSKALRDILDGATD